MNDVPLELTPAIEHWIGRLRESERDPLGAVQSNENLGPDRGQDRTYRSPGFKQRQTHNEAGKQRPFGESPVTGSLDSPPWDNPRGIGGARKGSLVSGKRLAVQTLGAAFSVAVVLVMVAH